MFLIAFTLGFLHAFDVDHIAAVSAFVSRGENSKSPFLFGLYWGLGHTFSLLVVGAIVSILKFALPENFTNSMEFIVGAILIYLGFRVIKSIFQEKIHWHSHSHGDYVHSHPHSHKFGENHNHNHSITFIGAIHGLAGTAGVLVLIPVALKSSILSTIFYIVFFGIGTITAMSIYSFILSKFFASILNKRFSSIASCIIGLFNIIIGTSFLLRIL